ncbi:MAG: zinc ribbon domain-containing protein [Gammaproteobacteria bacterium]|nr:zinc ribbon domain-containing protein [Gammaproteobacteria bacterium]
MPFYEYQCKTCQHHFEAMQKIADAALTVCPHCQKPDLEKLISSPSFQLKGEGWYVTDFKNKNKNTTEKKSAETETAQPQEKATQPQEKTTHTTTTSSGDEK